PSGFRRPALRPGVDRDRGAARRGRARLQGFRPARLLRSPRHLLIRQDAKGAMRNRGGRLVKFATLAPASGRQPCAECCARTTPLVTARRWFLEAARAPRGPLLARACCLCRETLRIRAEPRLLRTDARANPSQDGDAKLPVSADLRRFVKRVSRGR